MTSGLESLAAAACIRWRASTEIEEVEIETPFGKPSDSYRIGTLEGRRVAFLARHNRQSHDSAVGAEFSRQHLRLQKTRRRMDSVGKRRRLVERGTPAAGHRAAGSVLRPDEKHGFRRSLATASSSTSALRIRFVRSWRMSFEQGSRRRRRSRSNAAEHTCAWKGRSFRRWRNPIRTARMGRI